jgi:transposase
MPDDATEWVVYTGDAAPIPVSVRIIQDAHGRQLVTGLLIDAPEGQEISSQTLRSIRLRDVVAKVLEGQEPEVPAAQSPGEQPYREFARTYLKELARRPHGAMTAAANAHDISRATAHRWVQTCRQLGYLPTLSRRGELDIDGFYRSIATAYNQALAVTSKPAKVLAEEAGVPTGTAHRWVNEARRRGFLPPARQGRAG